MKSPAKNLNSEDIKNWIIETIIFSLLIPALIVFAISLGNGMNLQTALAVSLVALFQAAANLYGKYKAGDTPLPVNNEVTQAIDVTSKEVKPVIDALAKKAEATSPISPESLK